MAKLPTRAKPTEEMISFDLRHFLQRILNSPGKMNVVYQGMAHLTDVISEFWHSRAWGESVRTTSGQFFRYSDGEPMLPSDFVRYKCAAEDCEFFRMSLFHLGRIRWCGKDYTASAKANSRYGHDAVLVQELVKPKRLLGKPLQQHNKSRHIMWIHPVQEEFVLMEHSEKKMSPSDVIRRETDIHICYDYTTPKGGDVTPYIPPRTMKIVRYIYNADKDAIRAVQLSNPHRAELEITTFGREYILSHFVGDDILSLPMKTFIDAFGLFRNMYRSILAMYMFPAFLPDHLGDRGSAAIPIVLVPFGASYSDALSEIPSLKELDKGCHIEIGQKKVFVCAFTICFLGDMVQMNELSAGLGHSANKGYRFCLIHKTKRHDHDYNVVKNGQYHPNLMATREVAASRTTKVAKKTELENKGLRVDDDLYRAVLHWTPLLDIIRTRLVDVTHSEFTSLVKHTQRLLIGDILLPTAVNEFIKVFQNFQLPPGYNRIQSHKHHMESWRQYEAGEASLVTPVVLRCWLKPDMIKPSFAAYLHRISQRDFPDMPATFDDADRLITLFWAIASSNLQTCGRFAVACSAADFTKLIARGRKAFHCLFQVAAYSTAKQKATVNPVTSGGDDDAMSMMSGGTNISGLTQIIAGVEADADNENYDISKLSGTKKAADLKKVIGLPNMHPGLHLWEGAREYGSGRMVSTLKGEAKHK